MAAASVITLTALAALADPVFAFGGPPSHHYNASSTDGNCSSSSLADFALGKVLNDAAPVFGDYVNLQNGSSTWMKAYADETLIVHMNIPGTHDADTWNYSAATQEALDPITDLVGDTEVNVAAYRCQDMSMVSMLEAGIRVFDLRYAYDVTNSTLVFWHGPGLVSETATVEDVLFGFYQWLDDHPSEAVFLSYQYEGSTTPYATETAGVQLMLYDAFTSPASKQYILQTTGSFGTLGEARGKVTLLKRFDLDLLPAYYENSLPGVHFSPVNWTDNSPNITLVYNSTTGGTAYIEDYYQPLTPANSSYEENIQWKLNATAAHLEMAATTHNDSLFWSFASSTNLVNNPPVTPEDQAVGVNGSEGVNDRLVPFLQGMKGKRLGFLMFDYYEVPSDLVPLYLSLLSPEEALNYGS